MAQDCSIVGIDRAKSVLHLVGRGLGVAFTPPPDLARHARDRLFPWTPAGFVMLRYAVKYGSFHLTFQEEPWPSDMP